MTDSIQGASSILLLEWWKSIPGFEGYYEVSNIGNVCRVKPYNSVKSYARLRQAAHWDGRKFVSLSGGGRRKTYKIHKIIVDAFWGGTPAGMTVNHKNNDYTKNWLSNLEFMTPLENWRDAYDKGLIPRGERHGNAKVTQQQACEILSLMGKLSLRYVSERYGISTTAVSYIWQRRNWAHIKQTEGMAPYRKSVRKGEELPHAILTSEHAKEILKQRGQEDPKILAKRYGVSHWTIYKIWSGRSWKHIA